MVESNLDNRLYVPYERLMNWEHKLFIMVKCPYRTQTQNISFFATNEIFLWNMKLDFFLNLEFGIWSLEFGIWSLEFGVWSLEFGVSKIGILLFLFSAENKKSLEFLQGFKSGWLTGFEPATRGTTNRYSNQLSYNHHFCLASANI